MRTTDLLLSRPLLSVAVAKAFVLILTTTVRGKCPLQRSLTSTSKKSRTILERKSSALSSDGEVAIGEGLCRPAI